MSSTMMPPTMVGTPERPNKKQLKLLESPTNTHSTNTSTDETCSTTHCGDDSSTEENHAPPVEYVDNHRSARQRLREQEAKISAMLHKPTVVPVAAEEVRLHQKMVESLQADLKKTETEKQELQQALETVKLAQAQSEQKVAEQQESLAARTVELEDELRRKTHEASLLQDRWQSTVHRMVQYQVDLETHDLHFTDYAAQQFQAGQETLAELKELTAKGQPPANRQLGKKAKHMMSTLLKDLDVLGARYKESRVSQEQQMADLKIAQLEWQQRAEHLEAQCRQHNIEIPGEDEEGAVSPLKRLHQEAVEKETQKELQTQARLSQQQAEQAQLQRDVMEKEVRRLKHTVSQMERAIQQQQEALTIAQDAAQQATAKAAAAAAAAAAVPKKKKGLFGMFRKSKKAPTPPPPPVRLDPLPTVDVEAALEPSQNESKRFDMLHERMQEQAKALIMMQEELKRMARQKNQLQQTVADLRLEQEQDRASLENQVFQDLQSKVQAERTQEQEQAQATIEALRAQVAALQAGKNTSNDC